MPYSDQLKYYRQMAWDIRLAYINHRLTPYSAMTLKLIEEKMDKIEGGKPIEDPLSRKIARHAAKYRPA